ncbi:hypothetical protein V5799_005667 [Amblyomma americanum]|uniref:Uncharacterized protein n=1 Tax=Amblyomma americanum TaxID=6943 RepID=A0AAQ4DYL7_AMBAM
MRINLVSLRFLQGGFDARKRAFSCVPPGKIEEPGALTFFIVNESASGQPAAFIRLGVYNHHYARFMEITMSATHYGARREINGVNAQFTPLVTTPVKGPHVVQYKRTGGRLEVHMDRQLFVDRDALQSAHDLDNLVVFYTDQGSGQLSPFVFHEAHWTVQDVRRAVDDHIMGWANFSPVLEPKCDGAGHGAVEDVQGRLHLLPRQ